ncbi:hypothetical protein [Streptomyces katsurahamanus]|uniref:WXG100 family type VII secretion target n=1 Tax=Streptomyces katsurahamanus TaxID=2577098 RepID=A0ABW9P161_9ACTN|nr:hypothetical protein [Streptomyces katsurahamanus]MQS39320.1 hypothetical protein [Streptomyces katsurahamanus]
MAWEEWAEIKAEVTAQHAHGTSLNQLAPVGGGGSTPDLAFSTADKRAAVKAINDDLEPGVRRHGQHAMESVNAAAREFGPRDGEGWDTSDALKKTQETWTEQVKGLLDSLAAQKTALSATAIDFRSDDLDIAAQMARQSRIDDY